MGAVASTGAAGLSGAAGSQATPGVHSASGAPVPVKRRKKKKKKWLLILLILLLLLLLGAGGAFIWFLNQPKVDKTTQYWFDKLAQDGTLEGKTPEDIQAILDQVVEEGMFNVSINSQVIFLNSKSEGTIGFANVTANHFYARMTLVREDTGDTIFKSAGIKPGQFIDTIKLDKTLSPGEYDCIAKVIATDPDSLMDVGEVDVKVKVYVLE
ncbi:MAG: hypothetical protein LBR77_00615 [Lachnospiraceae bacterium]|jgi:hypothetical protein|nr:hypothetical protein [Lachnospiraceae bacterium]